MIRKEDISIMREFFSRKHQSMMKFMATTRKIWSPISNKFLTSLNRCWLSKNRESSGKKILYQSSLRIKSSLENNLLSNIENSLKKK
jgi:hypothetical protein